MDKYYENLGHKNNVILFMPSVSYQVQFSLYHLHCTIACLFVLVTLCSIDLIIPNSKWRMQNPQSETQIMPGVFLPKRIVLFCCFFFCCFVTNGIPFLHNLTGNLLLGLPDTSHIIFIHNVSNTTGFLGHMA